jgi:hypothetical protein
MTEGELTVVLLTLDALDVDQPLLAVHLSDLAVLALVATAHDDNLITLADRH